MNTKHLALAVAIGAILGAPSAYVIAGSNTEPMPITPIDPISVDTSPDRTKIDTARRAADTLETNQINRLGVDFSSDWKKPPVLGGVTDSSGYYQPKISVAVTNPCTINPNLASCRADVECLDLGGSWDGAKCTMPGSGAGGWVPGAFLSFYDGRFIKSVVSADGKYIHEYEWNKWTRQYETTPSYTMVIEGSLVLREIPHFSGASFVYTLMGIELEVCPDEDIYDCATHLTSWKYPQ